MNYTYTAAGLLLTVASALAAAVPAASETLSVLGSIEAPKRGHDGVTVSELSGLAWDEDEKLLYAVSDDGILHHFRLTYDASGIQAVEAVFATRLSGAAAGLVNAEGLAVSGGDNGKAGDSELLIAFEDGPSLQRFGPDGTPGEMLTLPEALADPGRYNADNSRLEAVAYDPERGIVTAPEEPMADQPGDTHSIYSLDGKSWTFQAFQPKRSNLKAIEPIGGGRMLVLERTRDQKGGPDTARLRIVDLSGCGGAVACKAVDLATDSPAFDDNFEGMTRLSGDLYVAATDKKKRDTPPTTFVLFTITP
ncbi:esterase-like activity of phytase family protein [Mesorhizobium marinum]|uniref:esterase-like activity of phytase family protein n=1 Tax=Mesorhizobium marinum TaxID=3228790 RepID=UPI003467C533